MPASAPDLSETLLPPEIVTSVPAGTVNTAPDVAESSSVTGTVWMPDDRLAVALAAQSILADLFASLFIVLDKPFVLGDFLVVGDFLGTVEEVARRIEGVLA